VITRLVNQKTKTEERKGQRIIGREEQRIRRFEDKKRRSQDYLERTLKQRKILS
jgi:hypothetical protein